MKAHSKIIMVHCGVFPVSVVVVCGATPRSVLYFSKRYIKTLYDYLLENKDEIMLPDSWCGSHRFIAKGTSGIGLIMLDAVVDTWRFWETLMHELHHFSKTACDNIGVHGLETEAYMFEYFFRNVRKKLQGVS